MNLLERTIKLYEGIVEKDKKDDRAVLVLKALEQQVEKQPLDIYENGEFPCEPFLTAMCCCTSCQREVPYLNYCGECGQKFKALNDELN